MLTPQTLLATHKTNVETLLGLSASGLDAVGKLAALNLETTKTAIGEAGASAQALFATKDPQALFALPSEWLQPSGEKASAYGRKVYDIVAALQAEFSGVAEAGVADAQKTLAALVDSAAKNAPAGSENAITLMKAAVAAANDAFESVQKAGKQATGAAEANFATLSAVVTKPAVGKSKRAA